MDAIRFDYNGTSSSFSRTPHGFLRVKARLSRSGIFDYNDQREFRPDEEVFKVDSLNSIKGAPITDLHPSEKGCDGLLTPANVKEHIIGLAESVERDGNYLKGSLIIFHEDAIKAIESGERKEISLGYQCQIEKSPGTYQSQAYDAVQKNIVINHIAIGPKGWSRAGPECSIRKDSLPNSNSPEQSKGNNNMSEALRFDGVDIALTSSNIQKLLEENKKKEADYQGRFDAMDAELKKEKTLREALEKPEAIDAKVNARLDLIKTSSPILGDEYRFDGKSDHEIKKDVISKHSPNIDLKDKDESYVNAAFEIISSQENQKEERNDSLNNVCASLENAHQSATNSAYDKWLTYTTQLWEKPLSGHIYRGQYGMLLKK